MDLKESVFTHLNVIIDFMIIFSFLKSRNIHAHFVISLNFNLHIIYQSTLKVVKNVSISMI